MDEGISPLTVALIGAGAAILGGLLTSTVQVVLDSRRARREGEAETRRAEAEKRQAVRLVIEELSEALNRLEEAVRHRLWWHQPRQLSTATWNEYRPVLAQYIDAAGSWAVIAAAYDAVNRLNWIVHSRADRAREEFEQRKAAGGIVVGFGPSRVRLQPEDKTRTAWRANQSRDRGTRTEHRGHGTGISDVG